MIFTMMQKQLVFLGNFQNVIDKFAFLGYVKTSLMQEVSKITIFMQ